MGPDHHPRIASRSDTDSGRTGPRLHRSQQLRGHRLHRRAAQSGLTLDALNDTSTAPQTNSPAFDAQGSWNDDEGEHDGDYVDEDHENDEHDD
jgi:hypothetical protein